MTDLPLKALTEIRIPQPPQEWRFFLFQPGLEFASHFQATRIHRRAHR